jgi:hypothetical protein
VVVEAGMRVPVNTIDEDTFADVLGVLGDFQRAEAFIDDVVPLPVAVTYEHGLARGASLRGRVGLVGIISTVGGVPDDALVDYGMLGTHPIGSARLGLGLYGRWDASEDQGSFGQNSVHHLALSADLGVRRVRPGLAVRVPVDGFYNDVLKSTISAYLQIPLN